MSILEIDVDRAACFFMKNAEYKSTQKLCHQKPKCSPNRYRNNNKIMS